MKHLVFNISAKCENPYLFFRSMHLNELNGKTEKNTGLIVLFVKRIERRLDLVLSIYDLETPIGALLSP